MGVAEERVGEREREMVTGKREKGSKSTTT